MPIALADCLYQAGKKKPPKSLKLAILEATERLNVLAALSAAEPPAPATEALPPVEPLSEAEPMAIDETDVPTGEVWHTNCLWCCSTNCV